MPLRIAALLVLVASFAASASASEKPVTVDVWPDKVPGETGQIGPEKTEHKSGPIPVTLVTNVTKPKGGSRSGVHDSTGGRESSTLGKVQ